MGFCILYCELEESDNFEDSFSYFCVRYDSTNNLVKSGGVNTCIDDIKSCISDVACTVEVYTLQSYNILKKYLTSFQNLKFTLNVLTSSLGFPQTFSLYEVFSYFFESKRVLTDLDMLDAIVTSTLTSNTSIPYCFCIYFLQDDMCSFSWFRIVDFGQIEKLGSDYCKIPDNTYKKYTIGKFMKYLRYEMAKTNCCIERTRFFTWDYSSTNVELVAHTRRLRTLDKFFSDIQGLCSSNYDTVVRQLSNNLKFEYKFSADEFVDVLSQSAKSLGLNVDYSGNLVCQGRFKKDYSLCISSYIDKSRGRWGIILDCEGNKNGESGLRELGGIIFCKVRDILLVVETFECTEVLLEETLQQTIKNYESVTERYIPTRGIDILTYGGVDACMIETSLRSVSTKQFRKKITRLFRYCDCREYIYSYIEDTGISCGEKRTLSNIARTLGVQVVPPRHNALADSRTLFNVLAFILQDTDVWVL